DSIGLSEALRGISSGRVNFHYVGFSRMVLGQCYRDIKAVAGTAKRLFELVVRMLLARTILGARYKRRLAGIDLLLAGYVHDEDLSETGVFTDRYFPGLIDWYRQQGFLPAEYPSFVGIRLFRLPNLYRRIRGSATAFVVFELIVRFSDVFRALRKCV